jgi:UDP-glucose 4-epimerase
MIMPKEKAIVLVTGGAGFVGSNVVNKLLATTDHKILVLDDLSTGFECNLGNSPKLEFIKGSVCDCNLLRDIIPTVTYIAHMAAKNIIVSTKNPRDDFEVNIGGTLNILILARDYDVKRVVYTSSASVYGNPRYLPINEDDGVNTLSPYSVSKLAGENYCQAFYESFGLSTICLRYSNVYGINQSPQNPYCGVISKFIDSAIKGEPPLIHGDGEQTRDFTYVEDTVMATVAALFTEKGDGQVFNVGTGIETSVNRLAQTIIDLTAISVNPSHVDKRDIDNIRRRVLNIEKIRKTLRWVPVFTLNEGIKRTIDWYKTNISRFKMD